MMYWRGRLAISKHTDLFTNPYHINKYSMKDIISLCCKYHIRGYSIHHDDLGWYIDVDGNVRLSMYNISSIPIRFGIVTGDFTCANNKLTSLEGCPKEVGGDFNCYDNRLTSLEGSPVSVVGNFTCGNNLLTSLEGCPISLARNFYCYGNLIHSASYNHLFELGYEVDSIHADLDDNIITNLELVRLRRQWFLKGIING
jgi:hypothetical protein